MKNIFKCMVRAAVAAVVCVGCACLPLIPVIQSPVSMYPTETHKMVSLAQFFGNFLVVGIRLRATPMTLPVLLGVFAAIITVGLSLGRFVFERAKGE